MNNKCYCGNDVEFDKCCNLYISGAKLPNTPEQLMRSRYTAYSMANIDYIVNTMCGKASNGYDKISSKTWSENVCWQKLEILSSNLESSTKGFVEFKAYFIDNNQQCILYEKSEFHKIGAKWFYVDGIIFS